MMKSLSALLAFATVVGLAGCANGATGATTAGDTAPKYTQCSPEFAVACRS